MNSTNFLRTVSFALAAAVAVTVLAPVPSAVAAESTPAAHQVNINTATVDQLSNLPRVGEKLAQRIVDFRKSNGQFQRAEDLMGVKGIGEKVFELLRPYVAVSGTTTLTEKVAGPKRERASKKNGGSAAKGAPGEPKA